MLYIIFNYKTFDLIVKNPKIINKFFFILIFLFNLFCLVYANYKIKEDEKIIKSSNRIR